MKKLKIVIYILAITSKSLLLATTAVELQGTYSVFKPKYAAFSPLNGFAYWHNKIAEHMYKYGNQDDATIKLTHHLFTQLGTAFYPTRGTLQPAYYFTAETISKLLIELNNFWEEISTGENIALVEQWQTTEKNRQQIEQKLIQEIKNKLAEIIKKATANAKVDSQNIKDLTNALIRSLLEQVPTTKGTSKYLPYTTHALLLSFLEAKSSTKIDVLPYMDTLAQKINAFKSNSWAIEFNKKFSKKELTDFWNTLLTAKEPIINPQNYEIAIASAYHASLQTKAYPRILQWQEATYPGFKPFPDCGET